MERDVGGRELDRIGEMKMVGGRVEEVEGGSAKGVGGGSAEGVEGGSAEGVEGGSAKEVEGGMKQKVNHNILPLIQFTSVFGVFFCFCVFFSQVLGSLLVYQQL